MPGISGWNFEENSLIKNIELKDFSEAVALVVRVGLEAEKYDHHPDIFIHKWNKVRITLRTHSAGGVTEKDFRLAGMINGF